jgi:hypothetical protein
MEPEGSLLCSQNQPPLNTILNQIIQPIPQHRISWTFIEIWSSHLRLGLSIRNTLIDTVSTVRRTTQTERWKILNEGSKKKKTWK